MISLSVLLGFIGFSTLLLALCLLFLLVWSVVKAFRPVQVATPGAATYPFVSILVPFFNEPEDSFLRTLDAIEATDYRGKMEVILIDDGSSNATPGCLAEWLRHPRRKHYVLCSLARNSGAKGRALDAALPLISAESDVVTVIDSDTVILPGALRLAVEALYASPTHAAACGLIVPAGRHDSWLHSFQFYEHVGALATIRFVQSRMGMVNVVAGAFSLHKTAVIRELGGWGEWLVEDIAWTWRALAHGYTIGYAPDAIAYTVCPSTLFGLFRQRRRWARGRLESFRVAWRISRAHTMKMLPWWLLWAQSALLPTLLLSIAAAWLYDSRLLFGLAVANWVVMALLNGVACLQARHRLKLGWRDMLLVSLYNTGIDTLLLPANVIGLVDELRGGRKSWLTR
ncbi:MULTISPECIES: glycosyltransferase family 2 protein [Luteibacter]|uniref:glycosyltransferase family 2 protein n=1 Tax=Luteibacter TaxID=242605 RepID=UPI00069149A1|nr:MULTISPECIES: glycosyltransferase family 2 protein [unclassified Luteibacter]MDR6644190.1 biofilm PGA synthesis N-glycosyltransferase PgaC [Luteibacter sp. 1214]